MIFALLFILAFLVGLVVFLLTDKWVLAVAAPCILFCLILFSQQDTNIGFDLVFGLPLVAVAGLLGAYVVVIRREDPVTDADDSGHEENESTINQSTEDDEHV